VATRGPRWPTSVVGPADNGEDVVSLRQFLTPSGPSYALTIRSGKGFRRQVAPAALLRGGHSTLFGWLATAAPDAQLDKGARKTLDKLRVRGLLP
jgi:hypothetical protein